MAAGRSPGRGRAGPLTDGTTILQGIRNAVGSVGRMSVAGEGPPERARVGVAVIGEGPYAEWEGDQEELSLDRADIAVVKQLKRAGLKVVVS